MSKIALVYGIPNNTNIRVIATMPSVDAFVKAAGSDLIDWRDRHTNEVLPCLKRDVFVTHIEMEHANGKPIEPGHFYME